MPPVNPGTIGKAVTSAKKAKEGASIAKNAGNFGAKQNLPEINRRSATDFLRSNEESAEDDNENTEEKKDKKEASKNVNYTGKGRQTSPTNSLQSTFGNKGKGKIKSLKKALPLVIIGAMIFLIPLVVTFFGGGSLLFSHIDERTREEMNVQETEANVIAEEATEIALKNGSLPSPLAKRLTEAGLEVGYLDDSGNFIAGLRPSSASSFATISTSDSAVQKNSFGPASSKTDNSLVLRFKNEIITSANVIEKLESDPEKYKAFKIATYGAAAGHYDSAAELFYSNINASRNVFANFSSTNETRDFREILGNYHNNNASSAHEVKDTACPENRGLDVVSVTSKCDPTKTGQSDAVSAYLDALYDNTVIEPDDCDWDNTKWTCALTDTTDKEYDKAQAATIAYLVNNALNANETYESIKYFLYLAEVMSKTKAGDGSSAPINEMLNYLTTSDENGISAVQSPTLSSILVKSFDSYNSKKETAPYSLDRIQEIVSTNMSAIKDSYLQVALGTTSISWSNNSASSFGIKDDSISIIKMLDEEPEPRDEPQDNSAIICAPYLGTEDYASCYASAHAAYLADHAAWEKEVEEYVNNYLLKKCNPFQETALMSKYGLSVSKCRTYHPTSASLLEKLSEALNSSDESKTTFLSDEGFNSIIGSHSGELFSKGAAALGAKIATTAQGGTIGTEESITAYRKETERFLALDASADRASRSPFDITSKNTFFGNIVYNLSSYLYTSPTTSSLFSSFSSLLRSSFTNILPGAFADNEKSFQTTFGECPEATNYGDGFACSTFSLPTVTFDIEYVKNEINSPDFESFLASNVDSNGKPLEGSVLAEYIERNNNRPSNSGYVNTKIADDIWNDLDWGTQTLRKGKQLLEFASNKVFQFFDKDKRVQDYFSTYYARFTDEELAKIAGNAYLDDSSVSWRENYAKAQLYCGLTRFLEQAGYFAYENTNNIAFNDYLSPGIGENPYVVALKESSTDFSTLNDAEYLAAISGMSEKEANIVLGYFAYESYLASIDYENRLAFGREETFDFENSVQFEETDPFEAELAVIAKNDHLKITRKDPTYAA